jgi:hypothetical protein
LYDEVRLIVDDITQQIGNDVHLDREINNEKSIGAINEGWI